MLPVPFIDCNWSELSAQIQSHTRYLISSHIHPDGDAVGAALALKRILKKLGKDAVWIMDEEVGGLFQRFYSPPELTVFQPGNLDFRDREAIIMADAGEWMRLGKVGAFLETHPAKKICIDHHIPQKDFAGLRLLDTSAPSTTVLVYRFLKYMQLEMTLEIAEPIYLGLIVDTQNFHLPNTTMEAHQIAAECLEAGVQPHQVYEPVFGTLSFARMRLMADAFATVRTYCGGKVGTMYTTRAMFAASGATAQDDDGFSDWIRSVQGVRVGLYFREEPNGIIKVSWRAKGDNNVAVSAQRFGGGGHARAAGAFVSGILDEVMQQAIADIEQRFENGELD